MAILGVATRGINLFRGSDVRSASPHTTIAGLSSLWSSSPLCREAIVANVNARYLTKALSSTEAASLPFGLLMHKNTLPEVTITALSQFSDDPACRSALIEKINAKATALELSSRGISSPEEIEFGVYFLPVNLLTDPRIAKSALSLALKYFLKFDLKVTGTQSSGQFVQTGGYIGGGCDPCSCHPEDCYDGYLSGGTVDVTERSYGEKSIAKAKEIVDAHPTLRSELLKELEVSNPELFKALL